MSTSGRARIAGVIGWPVGHSLSPRLHSFWLRENGIDGAYVPLPVLPYALSRALSGLSASGFVGVNLTAPHKEGAFALAHQCDAAAQGAGAANLLLFRAGRIEARNTDIEGLAAALVEALGPDTLKGERIAIFGAGGAARAAVLACDRLKPGEVFVLNRTAARADSVVKDLANVVSAKLMAARWDEWGTLGSTICLLINATSSGLTSKPSTSIALEPLPRGAAVCDIVYDPLETPLLARARELGLRRINGLGMLMHQAVPAFEAFYGIRPSVSAALRAELETALLDEP
jgi:shikimate dehydrogenase